MSAWLLLQIFADVILALAVAVLWLRLRRPPQDDPRLSRGLQLLQSKISVLEDLSDRSDSQVKQLTGLIDQRARLLQNKIIEAEHQVQRVEQAMHKSKEVAEIFQDKIPHQEIIERQNTIKYVKAAQMAHAGKSIEQIAAEVDLPQGQIEMIAKVNRDELMFDENALPEWAKPTARAQHSEVQFQMPDSSMVEDQAAHFSHEILGDLREKSHLNVVRSGDMDGLFNPPKEEYSSLQKLGADFRQAVDEFNQKQNQPTLAMPASLAVIAQAPAAAAEAMGPATSQLFEGAKKVTNRLMSSAAGMMTHMEARAKELIEPKAEPSGQRAEAALPNVPPSFRGPNSFELGSPVRPDGPGVQRVQFPRIDRDDLPR